MRYTECAEETMRTAVVPVWLSRTNHQYAHQNAHYAALLWNELVAWIRVEWAAGHKPSQRQLRDHADSLKTYPLHSHTIQAVSDDLWDAIQTSRTNKAHGRRARAPWRQKNYRPLAFSTIGWRVTPEGKLNLSFGQGKGKGSRRKNISIPLPQVIDARSGVSVPTSQWGEITLCWDRHNRAWSLHIPYHTSVNNLPQAKPNTSGIFPKLLEPSVKRVVVKTSDWLPQRNECEEKLLDSCVTRTTMLLNAPPIGFVNRLSTRLRERFVQSDWRLGMCGGSNKKLKNNVEHHALRDNNYPNGRGAHKNDI